MLFTRSWQKALHRVHIKGKINRTIIRNYLI